MIDTIEATIPAGRLKHIVRVLRLVDDEAILRVETDGIKCRLVDPARAHMVQVDISCLRHALNRIEGENMNDEYEADVGWSPPELTSDPGGEDGEGSDPIPDEPPMHDPVPAPGLVRDDEPQRAGDIPLAAGETEERNTRRTGEMICPFCGAIVDSLEYDDTDYAGVCDECGKEFDLEVEYNITYTTTKPDWLRRWKQYNQDILFRNGWHEWAANH